MKTLSVGLLASVVLLGAGALPALGQDDGRVAEQRNTTVFHIEGMT